MPRRVITPKYLKYLTFLSKALYWRIAAFGFKVMGDASEFTNPISLQGYQNPAAMMDSPFGLCSLVPANTMHKTIGKG